MGITSAGIGSGLDVTSLVTQLVAAERAPAQDRLDRVTNKTKTTISALGVLKAAMSGVQNAVNALKGDSSSLGKLTASSSKPELFSTSAGSGAAAGSYGLEVINLAQASKVATSTVASPTSVVGSGTVTIGVGTDSFNISLSDGANTLNDLRDKINQATDNKGVTATIINDTAGSRLLLTSRSTGTAKAVTVSSVADVGGGSLFTTSTVQAAEDAEFKIDGFSFTRGSNSVTDAIDGITFTLIKEEPGTVGTLNVNNDTASSTAAVDALVKSYNAFVTTVANYSRYDAASKTGGPLLGDSNARGATQQLRTILSGRATGSGDFAVLSDLGITTQTDGTLKLDSAKLSAGLAKNRDGVKALFTGSDGFATRLSTVLDGFLGTDGRVAQQTKSLQSRLDDVATDTTALNRRMAIVESRYRKQFTSLDSLLGNLGTTSSYLTQQLSKTNSN